MVTIKPLQQWNAGQTINIHLMPEEAYGSAGSTRHFHAGNRTASWIRRSGSRCTCISDQPVWTAIPGNDVTEKTETNITFDANHEMAGKELNFQIELVEVK